MVHVAVARQRLVIMATSGFTPATEQERFSIESNKRPGPILNTSVLSGEEARKFYENLVKDDHLNLSGSNITARQKNDGRRDKNERRKPERRMRSGRRVRGQTETPVQRRTSDTELNQPRGTTHTERSKELMGLRFLHCAHEGNISGLKDLLSKGVDINYQVEYLSFYMLFWKPYYLYIGYLI